MHEVLARYSAYEKRKIIEIENRYYDRKHTLIKISFWLISKTHSGIHYRDRIQAEQEWMLTQKLSVYFLKDWVDVGE